MPGSLVQVLTRWDLTDSLDIKRSLSMLDHTHRILSDTRTLASLEFARILSPDSFFVYITSSLTMSVMALIRVLVL